MRMANNPIETLAAALHAALLRDLPEIHYHDRDWSKYNQWKATQSREALAAAYEAEHRTGTPGCPVDCRVEKTRRPREDECEVYVFSQTWSSTALGYGGVGGQAITQAYTVVVVSEMTGHAAVYFGSGRLAYLVGGQVLRGDAWWQALGRHEMPSVRQATTLGWCVTPTGD